MHNNDRLSVFLQENLTKPQKTRLAVGNCFYFFYFLYDSDSIVPTFHSSVHMGQLRWSGLAMSMNLLKQ